MNDNGVTRFEDLPNEIFRNIFDYLTIRDLYRTFVGLNIRVDTVLRSIDHVSLTLWSSESANDPAIMFFASQLNRLMVVNDGIETIDLTHFSNVRSLKLKYPSNKQMSQLLQSEQLSYLEYLSLGFVRDLSESSITDKLHRHLFSNGFSFLYTCTLVNTPNPAPNWSISPNLRSLTLLGPVTLSIYNAILDSCPNLVRLILHAFIDKSIVPPTFSSHHFLRNLSIQITKWSTNKMIDSLLMQVPKLQRLHVKMLPPVSSIDFSQLASILSERTPRLYRFDCDMMIYKYTIDTDVVHNLHPCFMRIQCNSEYSRFHIFTDNNDKL
ncbi:unnamed protein product [Adineta steineri]|uniref:F-box domain-containing protein n=1 Tax=Adineta steineri TaxID=433720 RepID=A0A814T911_9BILA|nr:unnamed protein product [Adineta steineri]CAF3934293.1 unnamed protein product [Adineta steineri]